MAEPGAGRFVQRGGGPGRLLGSQQSPGSCPLTLGASSRLAPLAAFAADLASRGVGADAAARVPGLTAVQEGQRVAGRHALDWASSWSRYSAAAQSAWQSAQASAGCGGQQEQRAPAEHADRAGLPGMGHVQLALHARKGCHLRTRDRGQGPAGGQGGACLQAPHRLVAELPCAVPAPPAAAASLQSLPPASAHLAHAPAFARLQRHFCLLVFKVRICLQHEVMGNNQAAPGQAA